MRWFYCSFCDPTLPEGQQFLGNTVVAAEDETDIPVAAAFSGRNPGGEIVFMELDITGPDDPRLPPQSKKYFDRFVPREEALAEPHTTLADGEYDSDMRDGTICATCNPKE